MGEWFDKRAAFIRSHEIACEGLKGKEDPAEYVAALEALASSVARSKSVRVQLALARVEKTRGRTNGHS